MKQFTRRVRQQRRTFFDSRIIVAIVGLFLSVAFHELLHIVVHWGHITQIHFFPNSTVIVEVISITAKGYDVQYEETIAYAITLFTMLITVAVICVIHDKKDTRSFMETVFPKDKTMRRLSSQELFELATRVNLL